MPNRKCNKQFHNYRQYANAYLDMCVLEFNHLDKTKELSNTNLYFLVAMKTVYKCYKHTQPGP